MTCRLYQYKTDCPGHLPKKGDWVVQKLDHFGHWRNVAGPFKSLLEAEKALHLQRIEHDKHRTVGSG